jgi:hypothetical protein
MPITKNSDYLGEGRSRTLQQYKDQPRWNVLLQAFLTECQAIEDAMWGVFAAREIQNALAVFTLDMRISTVGTIGTMKFTYTVGGGGPTLGPIQSVASADGTFPWNIPGTPFVVVWSAMNYNSTARLYEIDANGTITAAGGGALTSDISFPVADILRILGRLVGQTADYGLNAALYFLLISARILVNNSEGSRQNMIDIAKTLIPKTVIYAKDFGGSGGAAFYIEPQGPIPAGLSPYIIAQQFLGPAISAGVALVFVWTKVARANTIIAGSVYNAGFSAGPNVTNTGVTSAQSPGSVYHGGYAAGPPVTGDGGGVLAGAIEVLGGP